MGITMDDAAGPVVFIPQDHRRFFLGDGVLHGYLPCALCIEGCKGAG
ncbi:MAG: hypothetical protein LBU25_01855 [Treponema sp.]|nr:hypothetical protein [Treponema sp.]